MPHDSRSVSETNSKEALGSLGGCLVEGEPEQRIRERRARRRSLIISISTQAAVVALLILLPLFGKTEHIALAIATPIPPYGHHSYGDTARSRPARPANPGGRFTYTFPAAARPVSTSRLDEGHVGPPDIGTGGNEIGGGPECNWCVDIGGRNDGPRRPETNSETPARPRVIREPRIDPAMLIRRIEPVYPPLAIQIHREGRVELRARISTDGTIESLEIISGDPVFYQSARDAVSQWLYRATVLNGQKVEVETYITVIYTMPH